MTNLFSEKTSAFLWEIKFNNERTWFHEHKDQFEEVVNRPMKELTEETRQLMDARYPQYEFQQHVSRIWRDARRLFGRGPLKEHLWMSIYRNGADDAEPSFWFGVSPVYYCWGMGFFEAPPALMEKYRAAIDADPAGFERVIRPLSRMKGFKLTGEDYKRPKADRGELLNPWYNKKYFAIEYYRDFDNEICDPNLPQRLMDDFDKLMPLYVWLLKLFGHPDGPGPNWEVSR